jgi:hypothetical protein
MEWRSHNQIVGLECPRAVSGIAAFTPQLLADSDSSRSRFREVNGTAANPCAGTTRDTGIPALQNLVRKTMFGRIVEQIAPGFGVCPKWIKGACPLDVLKAAVNRCGLMRLVNATVLPFCGTAGRVRR